VEDALVSELKRETVEVEVGIYRPNQSDDEIEIEVTVPASGTDPGRRLHILLTPAAFALALTGRGAIRGKLSQHVFQKRRATAATTPERKESA
jgi:hypothetical protein